MASNESCFTIKSRNRVGGFVLPGQLAAGGSAVNAEVWSKLLRLSGLNPARSCLAVVPPAALGVARARAGVGAVRTCPIGRTAPRAIAARRPGAVS